jgi:hypothetical protein
MRFASEGIEPITEGAIDSLDVNGPRFGNDFAQHGADLDGEQLAMLIAMRGTVCVKRTSAGTFSGGRPSFSERTG